MGNGMMSRLGGHERYDVIYSDHSVQEDVAQLLCEVCHSKQHLGVPLPHRSPLLIRFVNNNDVKIIFYGGRHQIRMTDRIFTGSLLYRDPKETACTVLVLF